MSATIDAAPVARFLGGAPCSTSTRARYPIEIALPAELNRWPRPFASPRIAEATCSSSCPARARSSGRCGELRDLDALVLPLHGSLDVDAQERALAPASRRKVILATNIAETSLTVEGVTDVVDSGLHKVLRFDAGDGGRSPRDRAHLRATPPISARAAPAARGPGRATRLWDERDILRPHREPEIRRVDLAAPLSTSWPGAATRGRSTGSSGRRRNGSKRR